MPGAKWDAVAAAAPETWTVLQQLDPPLDLDLDPDKPDEESEHGNHNQQPTTTQLLLG